MWCTMIISALKYIVLLNSIGTHLRLSFSRGSCIQRWLWRSDRIESWSFLSQLTSNFTNIQRLKVDLYSLAASTRGVRTLAHCTALILYYTSTVLYCTTILPAPGSDIRYLSIDSAHHVMTWLALDCDAALSMLYKPIERQVFFSLLSAESFTMDNRRYAKAYY
jgi:hypothetical protein